MKDRLPPKFPLRFLKWFCKVEFQKDIEGDLLELYAHRLQSVSKFKADVLLVIDVLFLFRPGIVKSLIGNKKIGSMDLYKNYFKVAIRHLKKERQISLINLFGTIISFFAVMIITHHILFELSFEDFYPKKDRLYRVEMGQTQKGVLQSKRATTYTALGPDAKSEISSILNFTRIFQLNDAYFSVHRADGSLKSIRMSKVTMADHSFLEMFSVKGLDKNALQTPNSIVLTKSIAKKLFGNQNPIGKTIEQNRGQRDKSILTVTGVIDDVPDNTHFKYEVLISYSSMYAERDFTRYSWNWPHVYTYLLLSAHANPIEIETQLEALLARHTDPLASDSDEAYHIDLRPIDKIHLYAGLQHEMANNGNYQILYFLILAAALILLISWLNTVNLSYVKHGTRSKEMSVRKVFGANRKQMIGQQITEALINNTFAMVSALVLVVIFSQDIASFLDISLEKTNLLNFKTLGVMAMIFIISIVISSITPTQLKSTFGKADHVAVPKIKNQISVRKSAIIIQFSISFVLIFATIVIHSQLKMLKNFDVGIDKDYSLVVRGSGIPGINNAFESNKLFKDKLIQQSWIKSVAACNFVPGQELPWQRGIRRVEGNSELVSDIMILPADSNIVDALGLKLIAGNPFSHFPNEALQSVMLNEKATKALGYQHPEDAIGAALTNPRNQTFKVVGIIEDFYQQSLKERVDPLMIWNIEYAKYYFILNLQKGMPGSQLDKIEAIWKQVFPNSPFVFFFLDTHLQEQYKADQIVGRLFTLLSSIGIALALMGIFSLSSFFVSKRVKEIGIRKVLGASVYQILWLLCAHLLLLIVIGIIIAIPITAYFSAFWLEHFVVKVQTKWWWYLVLGIGLLGTAGLTTLLQSLKSANTNPAISLKGE